MGGERWRRRAEQLASDARRSFFEAKIVADYHWLELELSRQTIIADRAEKLDPRHVSLQSLASLYFAGTVVEAHGRLTPKGVASLEGRLRDSLKAETGFASLYMEMGIAQQLMDEGYDVDFVDLEGTDRYDVAFRNSSLAGEVECKSFSADAGRKIHRKDFYRFVDTVHSFLEERMTAGGDEILVVTLDDRLPADVHEQATLRAAVGLCLSQGNASAKRGAFFTIELEPFSKRFAAASANSEEAFYKAVREAFGHDCHATGFVSEVGGCFIVMRSLKEDDTSKPVLEAMRKAAAQFSGTKPAFIAIQFNDIEPEDLVKIHLRRRMAILSHALFLHYAASHVVATYFCPYSGLVTTPHGVAAPAFSLLNPQPKFAVNPEAVRVFLGNTPDADYARLLGVPAPNEGISSVPIDTPPSD